MDKKHLLAATAALAPIFLVAPAHAQSASAVFSGPQNMDAGLQSGMNTLAGYVHFLPCHVKMLETRRFRERRASDSAFTRASAVACSSVKDQGRGDPAERLPMTGKAAD
jgi:hypothetical protein